MKLEHLHLQVKALGDLKGLVFVKCHEFIFHRFKLAPIWENKMAKIKLFREKELANKNIPYHFFCDGKKICEIRSGESVSLDVKEGFHEVFFKVPWSWHRSKKKTININNNVEIDIFCRSKIRGFRWVFAWFYLVFNFWDHVVFEVKNNPR